MGCRIDVPKGFVENSKRKCTKGLTNTEFGTIWFYMDDYIFKKSPVFIKGSPPH